MDWKIKTVRASANCSRHSLRKGTFALRKEMCGKLIEGKKEGPVDSVVSSLL